MDFFGTSKRPEAEAENPDVRDRVRANGRFWKAFLHNTLK
jgi:hypothetical protein